MTANGIERLHPLCGESGRAGDSAGDTTLATPSLDARASMEPDHRGRLDLSFKSIGPSRLALTATKRSIRQGLHWNTTILSVVTGCEARGGKGMVWGSCQPAEEFQDERGLKRHLLDA